MKKRVVLIILVGLLLAVMAVSVMVTPPNLGFLGFDMIGNGTASESVVIDDWSDKNATDADVVIITGDARP